MRRARAGLAAAILALAAVLVGAWPERLPGLHVDEAWSFFRAREIIGGLRPLDGMNYYTGALHHYLLAASVQVFGLHVWVIHLLSGGANVSMLGGYMLLVRRLHPDRDLWLWAGALTMSSATFVIYSRLGIELCTLTPLLLVGGALLVQRSSSGQRWTWLWAFAGGVLLGLAVYNHMAAAALVAGVALGYLVAGGARSLLEPRTWAAAAGMLAGLSPRIVQILRIPPHRAGPGARLLKGLSGKLSDDVPYLPELLRGMLDGDLIYHRVAGIPVLAVLPFFSAALALLVLVRLRLAGRAALPGRRDIGWIIALLATPVLMAAISDHLALRYYIVPALAMPYVLARLASFPDAAPGWARRLGQSVLLAVIGLQGLYVGVNYFYAHLSTGGQIHVFPLGKRVLESSDGFVRTDRLYARLVEMNIHNVVAYDFIRWPLQVYDIADPHIVASAQPDQRRWRVPEDGPTALVYYNGPLPMGGLKLEDQRGQTSVDWHGRRFELEPDVDPNFLVFVHRPPPHAP